MRTIRRGVARRTLEHALVAMSDVLRDDGWRRVCRHRIPYSSVHTSLLRNTAEFERAGCRCQCFARATRVSDQWTVVLEDISRGFRVALPYGHHDYAALMRVYVAWHREFCPKEKP